MSSTLLEKLFRAQAQCTVLETAELLKKDVSFPRTWEDYFRRLHDLKAQALAANLKKHAADLHKLEDLLWAKQNDLKSLKTVQAELEGWFKPSTENDAPMDVKEVLTLMAEQAISNGKEIGKTLDIRVTTEGLSAHEPLLATLYPALVHLVHNALTNGVGTTGMMWLHAYHENWHLVIEVEDDGGQKNATSSIPSMLSGRGMGLASIRSIMKRLKGEVTLEDSQRGGTKARLRLPIARPERKVS